MSDAPAASTASASTVPQEARAADKRGGPGHMVLIVVLLTLPALKVAWTIGEGAETRDLFSTLGPRNWPDVLVGMLFSDPLFACLLCVVGSRISYGFFAARGALPRDDDEPRDHARLVAMSLPTPLALGVLTGVLFGPWWGAATALASFTLRYGVLWEYRAGRRGRHGREERRAAASVSARRITAAGQWTALLLTAVVLPLVAFADALDGRSWAPVLECSVDTGAGEHRARVIEISRKGNGVVGWDVEGNEAVNGVACGSAGTDVIREPWWRR